MRRPEDLRWVFGYGSLMWRPDFPHLERRRAWLDGVHRAFCIYSVHHRGTPARRGLVLGLAPGGRVLGTVYRVADADWPAVLAYLREREQPTETYVEAVVEPRLEDGVAVAALGFLSDVAHPQWAGELAPAEQARLIAGAEGLSGRNIDYLRDLVSHLKAEGAREPEMEEVLRLAEALSDVPRQPA